METNERRRDVRALASPPVDIVRVGATTKVEALNVSYRGLFLRTEDPPHVNELLKLRIQIPGHTVTLNVVTVRVFTDAHGSTGVGVKFFGPTDDDKRLWDNYITSLVMAGRGVAA